jgi:hypothetical protein
MPMTMMGFEEGVLHDGRLSLLNIIALACK